MTIDEHRSRYNLACRIKGMCSFLAIWHGLWINRGLDKLRFLSSCLVNVLRWLKTAWRLRQCKRIELKAIEAFAKQHPESKVGDVVKPIALYLPQFHTFPENDEWWGKGFTEWTNVKKAKPLFDGHYQPHIPHPDLGYYDLSNVEVMRKQAMMAKEHGIYGFCFYYYHFANGKRLLEKPLDNWLAAKDIDFPFCYCWANENWTRAWDGGDKEVIMPQDYERDNLRILFENMLEAFRDARYIKIKGSPVLLVYRAEIVPNIKAISDEWRTMAKAAGFEGLYLMSVQNFAEVPPVTMGMDAAVEFAAGYRGIDSFFSVADGSLSRFVMENGQILMGQPYTNLVRWCERLEAVPYVRYKAVAPSWDNTPRKGARGAFVYDCAPKLFRRALAVAARKTVADSRLRKNGLLFINAWNEWGEGAHLEPDEHFGYGWLDAVNEVSNLRVEDL